MLGFVRMFKQLHCFLNPRHELSRDKYKFGVEVEGMTKTENVRRNLSDSTL